MSKRKKVDDENLILSALSLIWIKTNKNVESCHFNQDRVRMSFKKNEGCVYFDLQETLSDFEFINKVSDKIFFSLFRTIAFLDNLFLLFFPDSLISIRCLIF